MEVKKEQNTTLFLQDSTHKLKQREIVMMNFLKNLENGSMKETLMGICQSWTITDIAIIYRFQVGFIFLKQKKIKVSTHLQSKLFIGRRDRNRRKV